MTLTPGSGASTLYERDAELASLRVLVDDAMLGRGRSLVIEGPSGIGKSRLLAELARGASERGALVLHASASELEQSFGLGIVRQLFEGAVAEIPEDQQSALFRGPARSVRDLVDPLSAGAPADPADEFEIMHGVYWFLVNLAERRPVIVIVDDAQWADEVSLRFLIYLAQRLPDLPVSFAAALRTGDHVADEDLVARLVLLASTVLEPADLTLAATRELLVAIVPELGDRDRLVEQSWRATRGNPLLLRELATVLPASASANQGDGGPIELDAAPDSIRRRVLLRLNALGPDALALAQAVAVLGNGFRVELAGELAGLDVAAALTAAERLRAAQILSEDPNAAFYHAIVGTAVSAQIGAGDRAAHHSSAARILHTAGVDDSRVAMHLLRGDRSRTPWDQEVLQSAARRAARQGAPALASRSLRHALSLTPIDETLEADLLIELGVMEAAAGERMSLEHLERALTLLDDPGRTATAMYALGQTLFRYGRAAEALTIFRRGAETFAGVDEEQSLRFEAGYMASSAYLVDRPVEATGRLDRLVADLPADLNELSSAHRLLLLHVAVFRAMSEPKSSDHAALARAALGDAVQLWQKTSDGMTISHTILALTWCGDPDNAIEIADTVLDEARRRGDSLIFAEVSLARGLAMYASGRVADAMVDAQAAISGMRRGWSSTVPAPQGLLAYCHLDRGEIDEAREVLRLTEPDLRVGDLRTLNVWFYMARGRLRMVERDAENALADFLEVGALLDANSYANPGYMLIPWRSSAGLAAAALGDLDRAETLIDADIKLAEEYGLPSTLGAALRARALIRPEGPDIDLLAKSVAVLERASRLERAHSLLELGAARRRGGERVGSREELRAALDLTHQIGAIALGVRAHDELLASGARPRRAVISGPGALTPSEHRIAVLLATGQTSRSIAEVLFLTLNTVEWHRRNIYRKLAVSSRDELTRALAESDAAHSLD